MMIELEDGKDNCIEIPGFGELVVDLTRPTDFQIRVWRGYPGKDDIPAGTLTIDR